MDSSSISFGNVSFDRRIILMEIMTQGDLFKKDVENHIRENMFNDAVADLQKEFEESDITQEIEGGHMADNISNTMPGNYEDGRNLYSFMGFDEDPESVLKPIRDRLDPEHFYGPKIRYDGKNKNTATFFYNIKGPNAASIYANTPLPWAKGFSWAQKVEVGMPGLTKFYNTYDRRNSRSGGGIQVANELNGFSFHSKPYLTEMFDNFISKFEKNTYL